VLRRGGDAPAGAVVDLDEDSVELGALLLASVDPQRQPPAEVVEFADLDRCAERARSKVEAQAFVPIFGIGLDIADDHQVQEHQHRGVGIRHAQQPAVADADSAKGIELRRQRQLAERQQDAEQQADRNSEREIFRKQVRKHLPDDTDWTARRHDEVEQPQHLVEHEQHRGEDERAEQRHGDRSRQVSVNEGQPAHFSTFQHHHLAANGADMERRADAPRRFGAGRVRIADQLVKACRNRNCPSKRPPPTPPPRRVQVRCERWRGLHARRGRAWR
jgi:hypothetical protein